MNCLSSFNGACSRLLALVLLGTLGLSPVAARATLEDDVVTKNEQLAAKKKKIEELTAQERKLHSNLARLEKSVQDAAGALEKQEETLQALEKEQAETARTLDKLLELRRKTSTQLSETLGTLWPVYLEAKEQPWTARTDWASTDRQEEWLAMLYRSAQTLRDDYARQTQAVADRQDTLKSQADALAGKLKSIKVSRSDLAQKREEYQRKLKAVRSEKAQSEQDIQNLMGSIATLRHKIKLQTTKQISRLKGKLEWPAKGKTIVRFAPDGSPASNGIGLSLAAGTAVRSVSWGKVVHNDQLRGFGQVVIIFHGEDYYSLYAFLSDTSVSVGSEVKLGQQIGTCGFYPAAKGNGLYFELRFKQKAINPLKWLQSG